MEELESTIEYPNQTATIGKLALALSKAQGEMSGAKKSSENKFFSSNYADLYECLEAARAPLSKNELAVIQTTETVEDGVNIITTLLHSSGEWIRGSLTMKSKKDDDQGRGSSITYGRRYAFAAIVGLAQKDDDGNASCKETPPKNTPKPNEKKAVDSINAFADPKDDRSAQVKLDSFNTWWEEYFSPMPKFTAKGKTDVINSRNELIMLLEEEIKKEV